MTRLVKVGDAYPWDNRPAVGAAVTLNSGGPRMLVVDWPADTTLVETDWEGGSHIWSWIMLRPFHNPF